MAYMEEIIKYKDTMFSELWNSQSLKELMEIPNVTYEEFENHVTPFGKYIETITEQGSYLMFEVDPKRTTNGHYMDYTIKVWVLVSDNKNKTPKGTRVDLISAQLDMIFGDSQKFGIGKVENQGAPSFVTTKGFSGRELRYYTTDFRRQN